MPNTFVELASAIGRLNLAQGFSLSRSGLQAAGGSLAYQGFTSGNWLMAGLGAVVWAAPTVWGLVSHTDAAKLKAVEALPEVRKIVVSSVAPIDTAAVEAATDPTRPKVALAPG